MKRKITERNDFLNRMDIVFAVLFICIFVFNYWKIHYGFPSPDETFYISMVQRFYYGDIPLIHEWNPAQFPAILLIPFYSLFMLFSKGSTEGVLLYFRFLYILMTGTGGIFIYRKSRHYGYISIIISSIYMLYTFGNIQTMHYDTIGLFSMVIFSFLMFFPGKRKISSYIVAGVFFAFAVLCTPYLAIPYFFSSAVIIIGSVFHKVKKETSLKWFYITAGIMISAVTVCGYLLFQAGINDYIRHFPLLFSSTDTTYSEAGGVLYESAKTLYYGWLFSDASRIFLPIHLIFILTYITGRQRNDIIKKYAFPFLLISHIILMLSYWKPGRDFSMLTFSLLGFIVLIFDRECDKPALYIWITGLVYGWMADLTSDTLLGVLSSACTICALGSLLMVWDYLKRMDDSKLRRASYIGLVSLSAVFICMECFDKLNYTYQDDSPLVMNSAMIQGPAKGIRTVRENVEAYEAVIGDIDSIDFDCIGDNILVYSNRSWIYLYLNGKCACFSTWFKPFEQHFVDILPMYYEMHPEKIPVGVYMPDNNMIPYVVKRKQFGNEDDLKSIIEPLGLVISKSEHGIYCVK